MQQILVQKGAVILEEVPPPACGGNEILVRTAYSLVSTGTELAGLVSSEQSLVTRALKQPHNVKKAMKMASEKGFVQTYKTIKGMLDFGTPTGYSLAGEVIKTGANITDISIGDLVACSGAGLANHAEIVAVPRLLVTKIPKGLDMRAACSVTLGAIAMQGVRQAAVRLGETVAVIGLGLIGQLTCQLLRAAGCRVVGIDPDSERVKLATTFGIEDISSLTGGFGVDATIITASTESNEPLKQATSITRQKGTVVVVGAVGLRLERDPWYKKEIDLKISCSYGPGRYDPTYEEEMLDYPLPYVRWTENRNMEAYLQLLATGAVDFLKLAPREFAFDEAKNAYEYLKQERPLAVLLKYPQQLDTEATKINVTPHKKRAEGKIRVALIGAGAFAQTTLLPALSQLGHLFHLQAVVSKKGTTAKQFAAHYHADYCTTDYEEALKDTNVDAVLIATRHSLHAQITLAALMAGKAVFVEKPLAVNADELAAIKDYYKNAASPPVLTVGFNRRWSPYAVRIKEAVSKRKNPLLIQYRVNAGALPRDHWTHLTTEGGRIIGEGCHFFDLFQFWISAHQIKISAQALRGENRDMLPQDNFTTTITYSDGSVCTLLYTALGNKKLPKEYAEIYCDGRVYQLDDFKHLTVHGGDGSMKTFKQAKGHHEELEAFAQAVKTGTLPIPLEELFAATEVSFEVDKLVAGNR